MESKGPRDKLDKGLVCEGLHAQYRGNLYLPASSIVPAGKFARATCGAEKSSCCSRPCCGTLCAKSDAEVR